MPTQSGIGPSGDAPGVAERTDLAPAAATVHVTKVDPRDQLVLDEALALSTSRNETSKGSAVGPPAPSDTPPLSSLSSADSPSATVTTP